MKSKISRNYFLILFSFYFFEKNSRFKFLIKNIMKKKGFSKEENKSKTIEAKCHYCKSLPHVEANCFLRASIFHNI
jgi:hypothetical protein